MSENAHLSKYLLLVTNAVIKRTTYVSGRRSYFLILTLCIANFRFNSEQTHLNDIYFHGVIYVCIKFCIKFVFDLCMNPATKKLSLELYLCLKQKKYKEEF